MYPATLSVPIDKAKKYFFSLDIIFFITLIIIDMVAEKKTKSSTDNIFLFPSKYKEIFLGNILESTNENSSHMHDVYMKLMNKMNENNFHFIIEDNPLNFSHKNLIYELVRA
jgi:hypothetical protein